MFLNKNSCIQVFFWYKKDFFVPIFVKYPKFVNVIFF